MNPRADWTPEIARLYGLFPWDMRRLTPHETQAIGRDLRQLREAADGD